MTTPFQLNVIRDIDPRDAHFNPQDCKIYIGFCYGRFVESLERRESFDEDQICEIRRDLLLALYIAGVESEELSKCALAFIKYVLSYEYKCYDETSYQLAAYLQEAVWLLILFEDQLKAYPHLREKAHGCVVGQICEGDPEDIDLLMLTVCRYALEDKQIDASFLSDFAHIKSETSNPLPNAFAKRDGAKLGAVIAEKLTAIRTKLLDQDEGTFLKRLKPYKLFGEALMLVAAAKMAEKVGLTLPSPPAEQGDFYRF